jgi:uncharacterized repeat protein (TIGR02543 family)
LIYDTILLIAWFLLYNNSGSIGDDNMKYCKYLALLLFLLLCPFFVSAQDNVISKIIVKEVSGSTVAGSTSISGNTVTPDIDFYEVGDSVSYQLFVNYDSSKYKISYVSDNNKNRYVKTSYAVIDDKVFMTVTYPKKIAPGYGVDSFKIFIKLQYKNGKPIIPDDVLIPPGFVNPPTGLITFVIFSLLVIGSGVLSYVRKKKYYLLLIFLIPFVVYAKQSDTIEVNLNTNNVNIAYRVSFNKNGATSGSISSITCFVGQPCQLPENQYTKSPDLFIGWSKTPKGTVTYTDAQEASDFGTNTTLYAVWKEGYLVHYNGNGATSGSMRDTACIKNESCTLRINSYERTNYTFMGWATSSTGSSSYNNEGSYTNITTNDEITLYAVWYKNYTVHYNGNGATSGSMEDTACIQNTPCTLRNNTFEKTDYKFGGWATSSTGRSSYSNGGSYTNITMGDEITLYVYWTVFDYQDFDYTGNVQTFIVPVSGNYKLEVWGAQGGYGYNSSYPGGNGGYSSGTISLTKDTILYIYVGGEGTSSKTSNTGGGFNGGGHHGATSSTAITDISGGGGGGTDIRIGQDSLYARVIVAGGGGGNGISAPPSRNYTPGYGGGSSGGQSTSAGNEYSNRCSQPGTQSSGGNKSSSNTTNATNGTFGIGGRGADGPGAGAGGGGGWYGGGGAGYGSNMGGAASGGSGYVYTSSTASYYPSGCLLNSSYYMTNAETIAGNTSFTSPSGGTETGHSGNGYARISLVA